MVIINSKNNLHIRIKILCDFIIPSEENSFVIKMSKGDQKQKGFKIFIWKDR